jgi:hypothetical protein
MKQGCPFLEKLCRFSTYDVNKVSQRTPCVFLSHVTIESNSPVILGAPMALDPADLINAVEDARNLISDESVRAGPCGA